MKNYSELLKEKLDNIEINEFKDIIIEIGENLSNNLKEKLLCIIDNKKDNLSLSYESIKKHLDYIYDKFRLIEEGKICFRGYSSPDGTYSYYDENYDYYYYPTGEIDEVLNETYNYAKTLIYHKEYGRSVELFELILYTNYTCEEVGNPEYDDSDEVYDTYEISLKDVNDLNFSLDSIYLYLIYATLKGNYQNKNDKIYKYLTENYVNISYSLNMGIEKIDNYDAFYKNFIKYLRNKNEENANKLLERMEK